MSTLPPLPKIDGDLDLMLDVYTHSSLRGPGLAAPTNDTYGDTQRLEQLGRKVFELAVTLHLYNERPGLNSAQEMRDKSDRLTSFETIDAWLNSYTLKEKLRIAPAEKDAVLNSSEEMIKFFHIYIGAAYIHNNHDVIQNWISRLIDPTADVHVNINANLNNNTGAQPVPVPSASMANLHLNSNAHPPQQPQQQQQPSHPTAGGTSGSFVSLALVNQTAAQRRIQVTYPASQTGQSHLPTWTVRCCMDGEEKGLGVGKSQKIAKEEAARQAFVAMGWGI